MEMNLLVIEDDIEIVKKWQEALEFYAIEDAPTYNINSTFSKTLDEAKRLILHSYFDAIVIDIRLESEDASPNKDGNEILKIVTSSTLSVAAVCTGEPSIVDLNDDHEESVKIFTKGTGDNISQQIITWLDEKKSMISAIQKMKESFKKEMASIFFKSIWPRWSYWVDEGKSETSFTENALKRHMATHLHASFLNLDNQSVHPEEYFFIPPLQERLDTGDIILSEGKLEIIVTPRCDMVRMKGTNPTYQLVTLLDKSEQWSEFERNLERARAEGNTKKTDSIKKEIKKFTNHNNETTSHFIQKFRVKTTDTWEDYGPYYAQFNLIRSVTRGEETEKELLSKRIASLSNEFVPSLVERLGSFFSRIGTPDYSHPE
ncbi:hypothetical protein [Serratia sp. CY33802]|uniref:hypothetical protein n=1 Tax=Serratia sp. CY33802 TaxID=3383603 RepID=UPI0018D97CD8|nr:hypothetical protein [Serratia marcescens]